MPHRVYGGFLVEAHDVSVNVIFAVKYVKALVVHCAGSFSAGHA